MVQKRKNDILPNITPNILRAFAVTYLKQQGFKKGDTTKITGLSSREMIRAIEQITLARKLILWGNFQDR